MIAKSVLCYLSELYCMIHIHSFIHMYLHTYFLFLSLSLHSASLFSLPLPPYPLFFIFPIPFLLSSFLPSPFPSLANTKLWIFYMLGKFCTTNPNFFVCVSAFLPSHPHLYFIFPLLGKNETQGLGLIARTLTTVTQVWYLLGFTFTLWTAPCKESTTDWQNATNLKPLKILRGCWFLLYTSDAADD